MNDKQKRKSIVANDERMLKVLEKNLKKSYREEVKSFIKIVGAGFAFVSGVVAPFLLRPILPEKYKAVVEMFSASLVFASSLFGFDYIIDYQNDKEFSNSLQEKVCRYQRRVEMKKNQSSATKNFAQDDQTFSSQNDEDEK